MILKNYVLEKKKKKKILKKKRKKIFKIICLTCLEISGVPTIFYFLTPDGLTLAFCFTC